MQKRAMKCKYVVAYLRGTGKHCKTWDTGSPAEDGRKISDLHSNLWRGQREVVVVEMSVSWMSCDFILDILDSQETSEEAATAKTAARAESESWRRFRRIRRTSQMYIIGVWRNINIRSGLWVKFSLCAQSFMYDAFCFVFSIYYLGVCKPSRAPLSPKCRHTPQSILRLKGAFTVSVWSLYIDKSTQR